MTWEKMLKLLTDAYIHRWLEPIIFMHFILFFLRYHWAKDFVGLRKERNGRNNQGGRRSLESVDIYTVLTSAGLGAGYGLGAGQQG